MTTNITIKNNGPAIVSVRTHYLTDDGVPSGQYHGHFLSVGEEKTVALYKNMRVTVDEITPGVRTV